MPIAVVAAACGSSTHARPQPAERHLVYVAGETAAKANVWIADVNGAHPRKLGHGSIAVLSPDGRTVALSRPDGIHLVSSSGKSDRRLTARHLQPRAWSSDGETLIATRSTPNAVVSLVAIERRSGRVRVIARGSLYGVDVSPKGDELVYSRAPEVTPDGICGDQFDLYVSKVDGGSPSRLTHDGLSAFPVWGSSGIAYSHFHTGGLEDCSAAGIWTIDSDGSRRRELPSDGKTVPVAYSPDGSELLVGRYGPDPAEPDLGLFILDGTDIRPLVSAAVSAFGDWRA